MTTPVVTEIKRLSPHATRLAAPVHQSPAATRSASAAAAAGRR